MIIVGIDPGIAIVGYGVVEYNKNRFVTLDCGAILTPAHTPVPDRLATIYSALNQLFDMFNPTDIAVEELFFNTNQKTIIPVAEARGVILLAAKQHGLTIGEYTPLQVKQTVTGYGRADKKQVIEMVKRLLNLAKMPKLDDTADALAIAITHAYSASSAIGKYYNN